MASLFISYRRTDSEGEAGRLADDLSRRFGEEAVFMDVDTIRPGRDFRKAIDESIRSCDVLLALVGPEWTGAADAAGHLRLFDEADYVRLEIASALKRDIAVIPVMVRGARMPVADVLPPDLADFAYRNCVELTHARWRSDVQFLVDALKPLLDQHAATASAPAAVPVAPRPTPAAQNAFDEPLLHRLSVELARYIGPIAPMLVKRAARRGSGALPELVAVVSQEIDAPRDRAAYLEFAKTLFKDPG